MQITNTELLVIAAGVGLIGLIYYYFFGAKEEEATSTMEKDIQKATIIVDAAYIPSKLKLKAGVKAEITFDRKDKGDCTEWVILNLPTTEGREVKTRLPEGKKTVVSFTPTTKGEYPFSCGMGMVHGKLEIS